MNRLYFLLGVVLTSMSCNKDKGTISLGGGSCSEYVYDQKTISNFDFIEDSLLSTSAIGSTFFRRDPVLFRSPCFNPNNDYEICYIKDLANGPSGKELWKYSLCKNENTKLADNIFYSLDWSIKNWIIFTASDQHIYKVKPNGDSLEKITSDGGIHAVGKWSPDGTKFWYRDGSITYYICSDGGSVLGSFQSTINPVDWIDNNTLLVEGGQKFCTYNYLNNVVSPPLHPLTFYLQGFQAFNKEKNYCLVTSNNGQNRDPKYLLRYNFTTGTIDTLKSEYFSYSYTPQGSFNSRGAKVVLELFRANWLDKSKDWIEYRRNIVLMNSDGTNERMLNLN